jgi:hypothetical protein
VFFKAKISVFYFSDINLTQQVIGMLVPIVGWLYLFLINFNRQARGLRACLKSYFSYVDPMVWTMKGLKISLILSCFHVLRYGSRDSSVV